MHHKILLIFLALIFIFINNANSQAWTQKTNFGGSSREGAVAFSIGTKGYIGTGADFTLNYKDFWEYDPATNIWTQKADFGGTARVGAVGFSIGSKGYIGTGYDGNYTWDFWEYNPSTNSWSQKADFLGNKIWYGVGFSIGNKGYIGTGKNGVNYYQAFFQYDPITNTWSTKASFAGPAGYGYVGFSIDTLGYIATGGSDFWEYNPSTNSWTMKANFPGQNRKKAIAFSIGNSAFLGTGSLNSTFYKDIWEWNQSTNTWTQKNDFSGTERTDAVAFSIGNKGYIGTGKQVNSPNWLNELWEFDICYGINLYPSSITNVKCNGESTGMATMYMGNGASPFTYSWSNGDSTKSVNGLVAGTYYVTVTDYNGCVKNTSVTITEPDSINLSFSSDNICGVGNNNGSASVNISGGTSPYSIFWSTSPLQTTTTATGLTSGSYTVSILDDFNCTRVDSIIIYEFNYPTVSINIIGDTIFCQGDSVIFSSSIENSYLWSTNETSQDITVFSSGNYFVNVTDTNGCSANSPSISVTINPTFSNANNISICSGDSIYLNGNFQTIAGIYFDSLNSVFGCDSVIITNLSILSSATVTQNISICPGDSAFLSGGYQSVTGTYYDTLNANNGCDSVITSILNIFPTTPIPTISANGTTLSSSTVTGNQWYLNDTLIAGATSQNYTVTQNGNYTVVVTDTNGCSATSQPYNFNSIGISELATDNYFFIVPNPNAGKFILQTKNALTGHIKIFNGIGEIVYESTIINADIDLSHRPKGVYSIEFIAPEKTFYKKLIIQ